MGIFPRPGKNFFLRGFSATGGAVGAVGALGCGRLVIFLHCFPCSGFCFTMDANGGKSCLNDGKEKGRTHQPTNQPGSARRITLIYSIYFIWYLHKYYIEFIFLVSIVFASSSSYSPPVASHNNNNASRFLPSLRLLGGRFFRIFFLLSNVQ